MKLALAGSALVALAACPSKQAAAPISNTGPIEAPPPRSDAARGLIDGALWTCQIGDYDPQPCKLSKAGDGWSLTKLLGSQRFRGELSWLRPDQARFIGTFFCPWGMCDEAMAVVFVRQAGDTFVTTDFGGDSISLRYDQALANAWGGAGYGGLTGDEQ